MAKKKKVLLLGGTGAMGVYLAPELIKLGYEVHITTRSDRASDENVRYIRGDAHNKEFLEKVTADKYDAIVDFMSYSTSEFRGRYQQLLKNTKQYIFLSSYRVFADDEIITEESPRLLDVSTNEEYLKTDEYSLAKARQEDILRSAKTSNWTIVRPAITYSKERFQLGTLEADAWLWRALQGKKVILPKAMMDKVTTLTWAGDVAWIIARLVGNKKAFAEDFNVATTERHTWLDVVKIYQKIVDLKVKLVDTEEYISVIGGEYQLKYDRLFNRKLDNQKVLNVVGRRDFLDLSSGLHRELGEFIKHPTFAHVDTERHNQMDTLTQSKVKTVLQKIKRKTRIRTRLNQFIAKVDRYLDYLEKRRYAKAEGAILTLTGYFNYGNIVQRYALQKFLRKHNHNFVSYVDPISVMPAYYPKISFPRTLLGAVARFINRQKPYWRTPRYSETYPEAHNIENIISFVNKNIWVKPFDPSDNYRTYVVGSDQVWRSWWGSQEALGYYFFNFLNGRKAKRIAYAPSFGKDKTAEVMSREEIKYLKQYIEKFDHISVREKSGTAIIEKAWGIKGVKVVADPTLLLDRSDYSKLIQRSTVKHTKIQPIFAYILAETPAIIDFLKNIQGSRGQSITKVRAHGGAENDVLPPIELWLKGFRDADLVVTNSFHGMVLSVINNTDFIIIGRKSGGLSRIKDFLEDYGISDRFVPEEKMNEFKLSKLKPIDWRRVNEKLSRSRKQSGDWLLTSLRK